MMRFQVIRTFLVSAVALSAFGAFAATWTGKSFDDSWGNPGNWDGEVPGAADTAVFDGTSSRNCTIDVQKVKTLTISENYTGTLTLANDFIVVDTYSQANGTFTCGDKNFTIGQGDGSSNKNKRGFFTLSGGTFNCSSGITQWKPTNDSPVFQIAETATWNHNNGEFVLGGPNNNAANFKANVTFNNLRFTSRHRPRFAGGTTNHVLGTLTSHGVGFNSSSDSSTDVSKFATLAVKGDLFFDNSDEITEKEARWGGSGVILLCGDEDQVIHCDGGHLPSLAICKPADKKVTCDVPAGMRLALCSDMGNGYGPHLSVQRGTFVFPDAGLSIISCRYANIAQKDGVLENTKGGFEMLGMRYNNYFSLKDKIGDLTFGGHVIRMSSDLMITGNVTIVSGGQFQIQDNGYTPILCGEGDQHYSCAHQSPASTSGSSTYGAIKIAKPSGKLYLDSPLYAKFVTFVQGAHVVFPITNATDAVTAIGEGGWNSPAVIQAERDISLPKDERMCLEVTGKLNAESPTKWNVFKWGNKLSANYAPENFDIILPPRCTRPKLKTDASQKLVYLSYHTPKGLMLFVR